MNLTIKPQDKRPDDQAGNRNFLEKVMSLARVDFSPPHRLPATSRVVLATLGSIVGSLAADAISVVLGEAVFPSTKGYVHFQFSDYTKLTVVGVIIACFAWPVVVRFCSDPRWRLP